MVPCLKKELPISVEYETGQAVRHLRHSIEEKNNLTTAKFHFYKL